MEVPVVINQLSQASFNDLLVRGALLNTNKGRGEIRLRRWKLLAVKGEEANSVNGITILFEFRGLEGLRAHTRRVTINVAHGAMGR